MANQPRRTKVVNVRAESCEVYAGRPRRPLPPHKVTPGERGFLGNPFEVSDYGREGAVKKFAEYFHQRIENDPAFRRAVERCRGKTLGCFCLPRPCHAEVIARWLNGESNQAE